MKTTGVVETHGFREGVSTTERRGPPGAAVRAELPRIDVGSPGGPGRARGERVSLDGGSDWLGLVREVSVEEFPASSGMDDIREACRTHAEQLSGI